MAVTIININRTSNNEPSELKTMGTGSSPQFDLGHWILRLIALIIDGIIFAIISWILSLLLFVPLLFTGTLFGFWSTWGYVLVLPFVAGILWVLYSVILEVSWGATIGKRIMGLQVQTVSGSKITLDKAFIRNISKIFWLFLILDWLVAVATPGADRRQKYSDRMAGTTVVQLSAPFASLTQTPQTPPPTQPPPTQ
jgi:uncharacterized RDD family membrane protein YckC